MVERSSRPKVIVVPPLSAYADSYGKFIDTNPYVAIVGSVSEKFKTKFSNTREIRKFLQENFGFRNPVVIITFGSSNWNGFHNSPSSTVLLFKSVCEF